MYEKELIAVRVSSKTDMKEKFEATAAAHEKYLQTTPEADVPEHLKKTPFPVPSYMQVTSIERRPIHPSFRKVGRYPATIFIYNFGYESS